MREWMRELSVERKGKGVVETMKPSCQLAKNSGVKYVCANRFRVKANSCEARLCKAEPFAVRFIYPYSVAGEISIYNKYPVTV
jgi:hypothetical protein